MQVRKCWSLMDLRLGVRNESEEHHFETLCNNRWLCGYSLLYVHLKIHDVTIY
ncbi:hypothetical protein HanRHA438_Chr05g0221631 [Helianthus annuus]|nr:hypothetical protein HanIR_Chr05g0228381 [Helianthus annuus]KAJ0918753.1 hypothetical protein HanRHA438_Chr05g0221631 [Helianthus annuus]